MMQSPHAVTLATINEYTYPHEDLRIIAAGSGKLNSIDRERIRIAADELEAAYKLIRNVNDELKAANHIGTALRERLAEVYAKPGIGLVIPGPLTMTYAALNVPWRIAGVL